MTQHLAKLRTQQLDAGYDVPAPLKEWGRAQAINGHILFASLSSTVSLMFK